MKPNGHDSSAELPRLWPVLGEAAFHGRAGKFVRAIETHTEADPTALLIQFLGAFGNIVGRRCYCRIDGKRHHGNIFALVLGDTAIARKGTSWARVREVYRHLDYAWETTRIMGGLSSGEGLISAVRDPVTKETTNKNGEVKEETVDPGVDDKRLLLVEEEFSRVLRIMARPENILSTILRGAWDGIDLAVMTKSPAHATAPHISMIAHSTTADLIKYLDTTDAANGYANRFLFWMSKRSRLLPRGSEVDPRVIEELSSGLKCAADKAHGAMFDDDQRIELDEEAWGMWEAIYPDLTTGKAGLLGQITARGAPYVRRLALIYTMLDGRTTTERKHLDAALAVWRYAEASAAYVFGGNTGDAVADEIWRMLRAAGPGGMKQTDIHIAVGRHTTAAAMSKALGILREFHIIEGMPGASTAGGGRPATVWRVKPGV